MTYTIDYTGPTPVDDHLKSILTDSPLRVMGYETNGLFTDDHRDRLHSILQEEAKVEITDDVIEEQTDRLVEAIDPSDMFNLNFQQPQHSSNSSTTSPTSDLAEQISEELTVDTPTYTVESSSSSTVEVSTSWSHTTE